MFAVSRKMATATTRRRREEGTRLPSTAQRVLQTSGRDSGHPEQGVTVTVDRKAPTGEAGCRASGTLGEGGITGQGGQADMRAEGRGELGSEAQRWT